MSKQRILDLAGEEAVRIFPEFKVTNPSYISGIVNNVTDKFFGFYGEDYNKSEVKVREILSSLTKDLRSTMNLI